MNLAIFASGGGSNFQAIVDAVSKGSLRARVGLCVTNNASAGVLKRAALEEIPTVVLNPSDYERTDEYASELLEILGRHRIDFIALAGYMRMIPRPVVAAFSNRMLNIHPALLPAYGGKGMYGRRVHEAVIADGALVSGATVHLVDENYDTGPVVLQKSVPVVPGDTADTLADRILKVEHELYPEALRLFADGLVEINDRRVTILNPTAHDSK